MMVNPHGKEKRKCVRKITWIVPKPFLFVNVKGEKNAPIKMSFKPAMFAHAPNLSNSRG